MDFMKKFRIGSGLQNFHIRTPLAVTSDMPESCLSSQSHKPFEPESTKFFSCRLRVESWLGRVEAESSHKDCRVIVLNALVNVQSNEIKHLFCVFIWYEMPPNKLQNRA